METKLFLFVMLLGFFGAISTSAISDEVVNSQIPKESQNSTSSTEDKLIPKEVSTGSHVTTHEPNDSSPCAHFEHLVVAVEPINIMDHGDTIQPQILGTTPINSPFSVESVTWNEEKEIGENKTHAETKGEIKVEAKNAGREDRDLKSETHEHHGKLEEVEEKLKNRKVDDAIIREVLGSLIGAKKVEEIMPKGAKSELPTKSKRSISPEKLEKYKLSSRQLKLLMMKKPAKILKKKYRVKRSSYGESGNGNSVPSGQIPEFLIPTLMPGVRMSSYEILTKAISPAAEDIPTRSSPVYQFAVRTRPMSRISLKSNLNFDTPSIRSSSYDVPTIRSSSYDVPAIRLPSYDAPTIRSSSYDAPTIRSSSYDGPIIRSSSYDVPAIRSSNYVPTVRSSNYDVPNIRSSNYDVPNIRSSNYDVPNIRSSSYDAPAIRSSNCDGPTIRSSNYVPTIRSSIKPLLDLSDLPESRDYPFVRVASHAVHATRPSNENLTHRSRYDAPAIRSNNEKPRMQEFQTVRMTYEYDTPMRKAPELPSFEGETHYDVPADLPGDNGYFTEVSDVSRLEGPVPIRLTYDTKRRKRSPASKEISKRRVPMVLSTVSRLTRSDPF